MKKLIFTFVAIISAPTVTASEAGSQLLEFISLRDRIHASICTDLSRVPPVDKLYKYQMPEDHTPELYKYVEIYLSYLDLGYGLGFSEESYGREAVVRLLDKLTSNKKLIFRFYELNLYGSVPEKSFLELFRQNCAVIKTIGNEY